MILPSLSLSLTLSLSFCSAFRALLQIQALQPLDPNELIDDDEMTGNPKVCIPLTLYDVCVALSKCCHIHIINKKSHPETMILCLLSIVLHTRISVCPTPSSPQRLQAGQRWDWARGWTPNTRKPTTKRGGGGGRGWARSGRNRRNAFITTVSGFIMYH